MSFQGVPPPGPLLGERSLDPTRCPKNFHLLIKSQIVLLGMIMIVAYAGVITFLYIPKGGSSLF